MLLGRVLYHGYIFCRGFLGPNTVYSPPFRTEVSSFYVFFLVTSSFTCLGVSSVINPWIVPDHSPSTITRTDRNSWTPFTTHLISPLSPICLSPYLHLCLPRDVNIDMCPIAFGKRFQQTPSAFLRTYPSHSPLLVSVSVSIAQSVWSLSKKVINFFLFFYF